MKRALPVLLAVGLLAGCSAPSGLRLQGTVLDDLVVVTVPALAVPTVDLDAGFASSFPELVEGPLWGLGSVPGVAEVLVREGDAVTAGQQLVRLDDRTLQAQVAIAEADAKVATVGLDVLADRLQDTTEAEDEITDKQADLADAIAELKDKRAEVVDAIATLKDTRAELKAQQKKAKAARADLVAKRTQAKETLATLPPAPAPLPPGVPTREELQAAIKQLGTAIKQLDQGLAKLADGLKKLDKGLDQATDGLKKLDDALTKARDGERELADALADVRDARAELTRLRRLAQVAADTASVPVELAKAQLAEASITSPVDGVVVSVAGVGDRLAPGASLVTIRRSSDARVVTWLSPAQTATVCLGDSAALQADWLAPGLAATAGVSRIATSAEFPPTSQATDEVHLARAFQVELTTTAALPPGVPVTLSLTPCKPASPDAPE